MPLGREGRYHFSVFVQMGSRNIYYWSFNPFYILCWQKPMTCSLVCSDTRHSLPFVSLGGLVGTKDGLPCTVCPRTLRPPLSSSCRVTRRGRDFSLPSYKSLWLYQSLTLRLRSLFPRFAFFLKSLYVPQEYSEVTCDCERTHRILRYFSPFLSLDPWQVTCQGSWVYTGP